MDDFLAEQGGVSGSHFRFILCINTADISAFVAPSLACPNSYNAADIFGLVVFVTGTIAAWRVFGTHGRIKEKECALAGIAWCACFFIFGHENLDPDGLADPEWCFRNIAFFRRAVSCHFLFSAMNCMMYFVMYNTFDSTRFITLDKKSK